MSTPTPFDGYVEVIARIFSTCLVMVERNQYSVPCHLANSKATIHLYADRDDICTENSLITRHERLLSRDQVSYDWQHFMPLIERKPGALRNGAPCAELLNQLLVAAATDRSIRAIRYQMSPASNQSTGIC